MRWRLGVLATGLLVSAGARSQPFEAALECGQWGLGPTAEHALALQVELRPGVRWWWVRPVAGFLQSTDGTQMIYGGVLLDIPILPGVTLSPGFAPMIRFVDGTRDFGSHLLFKTSIELGVPLLPGLRALANFAHISNGKLAKPNPGIEMLMFGVELALE